MDQVLIYWKEMYLIYALAVMGLEVHCAQYTLSRYCNALISGAEKVDADALSPFSQRLFDLPPWLAAAVALYGILVKGIAWPLTAVQYGIHFMGKGDWEQS